MEKAMDEKRILGSRAAESMIYPMGLIPGADPEDWLILARWERSCQ